jgi:hypothetical protein
MGRAASIFKQAVGFPKLICGWFAKIVLQVYTAKPATSCVVLWELAWPLRTVASKINNAVKRKTSPSCDETFFDVDKAYSAVSLFPFSPVCRQAKPNRECC